MARYGQQFKDNVVARLLPPQSSPIETVSAGIGIGVGTLERWRAEALARAAGGGESRPSRWTPAARLDAVIATASMDEAIVKEPREGRPTFQHVVHTGVSLNVFTMSGTLFGTAQVA